MSVDRSLRRHRDFGADPHAGFDLVWMATTDLGYLDRRLWDDAGTIEGGPWVSTELDWGEALVRARLSARAGLVYRVPGAGIVSSNRYDFEPMGRVAGEASVRAPSVLGTTLGARVYAGAYVAESRPPRQRRIMLAGADPYATSANPLLRSRGALLARPGFHYHAPGGANLRGFSGDLGGRWAVAVNLEARRALVRGVSLLAFADLGLVDSLAIPSSPPGRSYTTLYDGGVGLVSRQRAGDLVWTFRLEFPFIVNRWTHAADYVSGDGPAAFRWQVGLGETF